MPVRSFIFLAVALALTACGGINPFHTDIAAPVRPSTVYPDASTPPGLRVPGTAAGQDEYNGGIIDEVSINGHGYNVVTDALAARVKRWEIAAELKWADGIILSYPYAGHTTAGAPKTYILTAVDVDVMRQYDFH